MTEATCSNIDADTRLGYRHVGVMTKVVERQRG
jgi:hypothetical protein